MDGLSQWQREHRRLCRARAGVGRDGLRVARERRRREHRGVRVQPVSAAAHVEWLDDSPGAPTGRRAPAGLFSTASATGTIYWEFVVSQPALHIVSGYSYLAATTGDSAGVNNAATQFMVTAWNAAGTQYWSSAPLGGYSVDNLPPYTPASLIGNYGGAATHLHWQPNADADLANYRL